MMNLEIEGLKCVHLKYKIPTIINLKSIGSQKFHFRELKFSPKMENNPKAFIMPTSKNFEKLSQIFWTPRK